jgi:poly(A) polymerase
MGYETILDTLTTQGFSVVLRGCGAIDRYLGRDDLPFVFAETDADLSDLARLFDDLRFPGAGLADGAVNHQGFECFFRCVDPDESSLKAREGPGFKILSFAQDWKTKRFRDPEGVYPLLRAMKDELVRSRKKNRPDKKPLKSQRAEPKNTDEPSWWNGINAVSPYRILMDGALILARYPAMIPQDIPAGEIAAVLQKGNAGSAGNLPEKPDTTGQRLLLTGLLSSPRPDLGLELLKITGFAAEFWPELAVLDDVDHSKEFHPEGNVWKHTLETFRYRKTLDLRLSLGLLLHDTGKAQAESSGGRRFDGHAELGARLAGRFLRRLRFNSDLINDVYFLVRNHMFPAVLPRLPFGRSEEIIASPLFPLLLELYRCDESSSFKDLGGYYESSAAYQTYLRYRRNPYRNKKRLVL